MESGKSLIHMLSTATVPDCRSFLQQAIYFCQSLSASVKHLYHDCQLSLQALSHEKVPLSESELKEAITSTDPGNRPSIKTDLQRKFLLQIGPQQPVLPKYPLNEACPAGRQRRFCVQWFDEYPHLEYSIENDAAYCFPCSLFNHGPNREKSEEVWSMHGMRLWHRMKSIGKGKKGKLEKHFSSNAHCAAVADLSSFSKTEGHINLMYDKKKRAIEIRKEKEVIQNRKVIEIFLDITRTLGRQGLAFREDAEENGNFFQIVRLVARHSPTLKSWFDDKYSRPYHATYCSPESQNIFIELLADAIRKEIIARVKDAQLFSVLADTTPDTSHTDRLSCAVRFVGPTGEAEERLIEVKELKDKTGLGHARAILATIDAAGLNCDYIAFQSYDFAATMSGECKGAQAMLSKELKRHVPYIPCQRHRTNTIIEHAARACPLIISLFEQLEALYVFFVSSTKRNSVIVENIAAVENALQLRNLSETRWTARAESVQAVWVSYEAIIESLQSLKEKPDDSKMVADADSILRKILRFDFVAFLMFMKNVMWKTKILTEHLQEEKLNIIDALTAIKGSIISLQRMNASDEEFDNLIQAAAIFVKRLGVNPENEYERFHRPRKPPRKIDDNPATASHLTFQVFYRSQMRHVLCTLITELSDNLQSCIVKVKPLSILQPPLKLQSLQIQDVEGLCQLCPANLLPDAGSLFAEIET